MKQIKIEVFVHQGRRGFLGGRRDQGHLAPQGQTPQGHGQRRQSWRSRLPQVTGDGDNLDFASPIDLFISYVSKEISEKTIKDHMLESKKLTLLDCKKVSHEDARTSSFRVRIKVADYDLAMTAES